MAGARSSPHLGRGSQGESSQCSDMSSYEEPPSPLSAASPGAPRPPANDRGSSEHGERHGHELPLLNQSFLPSDPTKWNVEDVYEFICSLPGRYGAHIFFLVFFISHSLAGVEEYLLRP